MAPLVQVRQVGKEFLGTGFLRAKGGSIALREVDLEIQKGETLGLVGESGSGKTTLARVIGLLEPPSGGRVDYLGHSLWDASPARRRRFARRIQIVFQDPHSALNPRLKLGRSLKEGLDNLGVPPSEQEARLKTLLNLVGMDAGSLEKYPHEFSGGQKQRLVIARALSMEPEFLILDEPVSSLDVSIQAQIINLLADLKKKLHLTYLFISHDLNLVAYLSDRIAVMYAGRIMELAPTDRLLKNPLHPYTRCLWDAAPDLESPMGGDLWERVESGSSLGETDPVGGCPLAPSCPTAWEKCLHALPGLEEQSPGHWVACFRPQNLGPVVPGYES